MNFPDRLKALREKTKISQTTLGAEFGMSDRIFRYYEAGEKEPTLSVLTSLADYFDVSLDYLVGRTDNPEVNRQPVVRLI